MILVNALDWYLEKSKKKTHFSFMLRGSNKTASSILALKKFKNSVNLDLEFCLKSNGWIFYVDLVSLYHRLEHSPQLNHIKCKHRAITVTSGKDTNYIVLHCFFVDKNMSKSDPNGEVCEPSSVTDQLDSV